MMQTRQVAACGRNRLSALALVQQVDRQDVVETGPHLRITASDHPISTPRYALTSLGKN
jgi:hypothetical protein